ncbi:LicD family protein [Enterococcus faecium]|uniref:LicD family protein n=1 Tax=Enterococcus faecium TaxID=1352 RepID=UPI000F5149D8|nr:LicD family protein [Enterococcus faecium]MDV7731917.1 LicD family protein [Enterococcus faecium]ROY96293.1 LicD family protein [Enterococcus faecium]ROY97272.1 LicD family protein [Enterococcus faecium]RXE89044.1 LicD family protein [Enterococcus faecium]
MVAIDDIELKQILLDMMKFIDETCQSEDIPYSLAGGSLLGAIRHKGFIPWDDDLDIFLERKYYDKLIQVLLNATKNTNYEIYQPGDKHYRYGFAKLVDKRTKIVSNYYEPDYMGAFIDIFPFDGLPDNNWKEYIRENQKKWYSCLMSSAPEFFSSEKKSRSLIKFIIFSPRYIKNKFSKKSMETELIHLNESLKQISITNSKNCGFALSRYDKKECFSIDVVLGEYQKVSFEGVDLQITSGYNSYLSNLYGDYMEIPPVEKRVNHSYYKYYWR